MKNNNNKKVIVKTCERILSDNNKVVKFKTRRTPVNYATINIIIIILTIKIIMLFKTHWHKK